MRHPIALGLVVALLFSPAVAAERAAPPPKGAEWTEHYLPSEDGLTMLHADVLRPKHLPKNAPTPVILTVSPYLNHSGQTTDFSPTAEGPSDRFYDFLDLTNVIKNGYTYVMVDLPGNGGSGGCNDWGGVREQGAVKAAVEWAASQKWSTGRVGLMGKSYDAWTGLMGIAQRPKGLKAVVAMEPVFAGYRYLYNNGVRFLNSVATPTLFQAIDAKPGSVNDDPMYNVNGAPQAWCYGVNIGLQQQDDPDADFWVERDLLLSAKKARTPLFLTQGFLETNTKPDGAFDFFNGLRGPNRAWFGQFDHVRGWEQDDAGNHLMGRDVFVEEMMRFFDRHLKGSRARRDPNIAVQDALGRYRPEKNWPPVDASMQWNDLHPGTYEDDGSNRGTGTAGGQGIWTISQPLPYTVWLAGEPVVKATVQAAPRSNLVANLYAVAPNGRSTLVSRGAHLIRGAGSQEVEFELYGQDWPLKAGHRLGVLLSGANAEWWTHVPTGTPVTVESARIGLPTLKYERKRFLDGERTTRLKSHMESAFVEISKEEISEARKRFDLPPRLRPRG
jgi:predicted acyl esterase